MLVRAMRTKSNLKVRQPLKRIILPIADAAERAEVERTADIICDEVNVKLIEYVTDESGIVRKKAKPNFKSIGPKFGKNVQTVAARIKELTGAEIAALEGTGTLELTVNGAALAIGQADVEIVREDLEGWLVESEGGLTVALDTELTPALVAEGSAREFVNRVQNMRKEAGFALTDRITITFSAADPMRETLLAMAPYISAETLALALSAPCGAGEHQATIDVNGEEIRVSIARTGNV
jgi:isoleucyl-tRNA synthetase